MEIQHFIAHKQSHYFKDVVEGAWNNAQTRCAKTFQSTPFEIGIMGLVCFSFVLVVMEADFGEDVPLWLLNANFALMWLYTIEMTIRLFIYRWWFFTKPVNVWDLFVVIIELITQALTSRYVFSMDIPSVTPLRLVRLLRVVRGYKVLVKFPQLALMMKGLISGTSAAVYGMALLAIMLAVWSIFAVHLIHPINQRVSLTGAYDNCARCPDAFVDVRSSMLTFFQQIIAGDSWGMVTMPIIEEEPWTTVFFGLVFISVQFTLMNVILAVIVDSSLKASQEDVEDILKQKQNSQESAKNFLKEICKEMDSDNSGDLTEEELFRGYEEHKAFRDILTTMDIKQEDLNVVFNILDADGSGYVDYEEFITELFKLKQHDSHTLLVFIKHYITEIRRELRINNRNAAKDLPRSPRVCASPGRDRKRCPAREEKKDMEGNLFDFKEATPGAVPELRSLREQLGEELNSLNTVLSEELLMRVQAITRKLEMPEDEQKAGHGAVPSSLMKAPATSLTRSKAGQQVQALDLSRRGPNERGDASLDCVQTWDSVQPSPRQESSATTPGNATASMPSSVWGIRARCEEDLPTSQSWLARPAWGSCRGV